MASFDKYSNYDENSSFSSIVFGANRPILEVELNEMQQIIASKFERICSVIGNGYYPINSGDIVCASNKTVTVNGGIIISSLGVIKIKESSSVVYSTSNPFVYFEIKEVDITKDSEIRSCGNTQGSVIQNKIVDERIGAETSRRKALTYTLKVGVKSNLTNVNYIGVGIYEDYSFNLENGGLLALRNDVLSLGRKEDTVVGKDSVALGIGNTASNSRSFALGELNNVSGSDSFALGRKNTVSSGISVAFNEENTAKGGRSTAFGYKTSSEADSSFSEGMYSKAKGTNSHSMGNTTTALQNQLAIGAFNDDTLSTQNATSGSSEGTAFVIGNGSNGAKSNAFRVRGDGVVYAKGAYNANGADYAEYAEWADGNPNNEDRRGYFVTFDEEKPNMIRRAKADDLSVLGVVSGNPCVVGNSDECWTKQFLTDDFGCYLYENDEEDIEITVKDLVNGEEVFRTEIVTLPIRKYIQNPEYNPEQEYIHRSNRPEWCAVGWIGVLPVREDGTCEVGGYCTWSDDGLATKAEPSRFNYRVLERVNENIIKVAIK